MASGHTGDLFGIRDHKSHISSTHQDSFKGDHSLDGYKAKDCRNVSICEIGIPNCSICLNI